MPTSNKDYSDINRIALGHIPHRELAQKVLQQTRSSEELMSMLRAAHDRILHLVLNPGSEPVQDHTQEIVALKAQIENYTTQLELRTSELEAANNNLERVEAELDTCKAELTQSLLQKQTLETELQRIHSEYDLSEETEGETASELNPEPEAEMIAAKQYYVPTRDELRDIALARGFRVRPQPSGKEDLNEYVYDTMYDSIKLSHDKSLTV